MTSLAPATKSPARYSGPKVVNFVPEAVAAPFLLRCGALMIDYMLVLAVPVAGLLGNRFFSDGAPYTGPGFGTWTLSLIVWAVNFLLLPLVLGQTVGKLLTGLRILYQDGDAIDLAGVIKRNVLGYAITALTLGLGFLSAAFSRKGRALHDIVAGTVVIRGRKTQL